MLFSTVLAWIRVVLFFVFTFLSYRALNAVDASRLFRQNATEQIRLIYVVVSIILASLFSQAIAILISDLMALF